MPVVKCETLQTLTPLETLVINAVRAIGNDLQALERFEMDFIAQFGPRHGRRAFYALLRMGKLFRRFGRRSWGFNLMGCSEISAAERGLLTMIAAQQAGNPDHAVAISRWFCGVEAYHDIALEAAVVGSRFSKNGQEIPLRTVAAPAQSKVPRLQTVVSHVSIRCPISAN